MVAGDAGRLCDPDEAWTSGQLFWAVQESVPNQVHEPAFVSFDQFCLFSRKKENYETSQEAVSKAWGGSLSQVRDGRLQGS